MIMNYIFNVSNISFRKNFLIFTNYIIDANIKLSHPIIIIFNKKITTINSIILKKRNNFKNNIIDILHHDKNKRFQYRTNNRKLEYISH